MSNSTASAKITKPSKPAAPTACRIKLRASCDRCSTNKIKCSQEKPICQRCSSLDLTCHYSRSMRSGKPPRSRQRVPTFVGNIQTHPKPQLLPPPSRGDGYHNGSRNDMMTASLNDINLGPVGNPPVVPVCVGSMDSGGLDTMLATSVTPPAANPYGFYYSEHSPEKYILSSSSYTPIHPLCKAESDISQQQQQQQQQQQPPALSLLPPLRQIDTVPEQQQPRPQQVPYVSPCSSFSTRPSTLDTIASPLASTFDKVFVGTSESIHDCVGLALATLSSLYNLSVQTSPSGGQTDDMQSSAPTIDQVLQVTSFATKNTMNLISCPCTKEPCFPILMPLIYFKILTWYQAIVRIHDPAWLGVGHTSSKASVVPRPLSIGTYKLEEEVGKLMTHQLVLNQLREMAKSVKMFLDIFYGGGGGAAAAHVHLNETDHHPDGVGPGTGNRDPFQLRMGLSLDARLKYTIQEVERILPACQC